MQENASRPQGLPPSQGGKYVGFGSTPSPAASSSTGAGNPDVSAYLTKGFSQLSTVAGPVFAQACAPSHHHLTDFFMV